MQRLAVLGASSGEIEAKLDAFAAGETAALTVAGQAPANAARLVFVFSGNGSQWRGMGGTLLADPFVAEWIGRVDAALHPHLGWSVKEVLQSSQPEDLYDRTEYAQPALFALQVAVLEWLRAHGVEAEAMLGHSVGEIAAAYAAGILSLPEACRVIAVRSQAQQRTAGAGRMAALGLSAAAAFAAIEGYEERLTIAGINSPNSVTIAGDADAIKALGDELKDSGTFYRELALDYAFHSRAMDPVQRRTARQARRAKDAAGDPSLHLDRYRRRSRRRTNSARPTGGTISASLCSSRRRSRRSPRTASIRSSKSVLTRFSMAICANA